MARGEHWYLDPDKWKAAVTAARDRLEFPSRGERGSEANRKRRDLSGKVHKLALEIYRERYK